MNHRVAVVTDSTASIPPKVSEQLGIFPVQLELTVGGETNDERRVPHADLARAMTDGVPVDTSEPPPPAFFWNYSDAQAAGAEAVLSVHISEQLSRTCASARVAAEEVGVPVYVVDSQLVGMSLGCSVIAAAEAAHSGCGAAQVMDVLDHRMRNSMQLLYVDTLEHLRRGGRIGRAQAWLGGALSVKPVLAVNEGMIDKHLQAMGRDRALRKMVRTAVEHAGGRPVDIGVEHFTSPEDAQELLHRIQRETPLARRVSIAETSAVLGAHTGPGAIGVTVSPAER
ncbi:DegV family protein [Salinifilum ghardaiensis]